MRVALSLAFAVFAGTLCGTTHAQSGMRTVWDGVYSEPQASRGAAIYAENCALCHGPTLAGSDGPPLAGVEFSSNWNTLTLGDLSERVRTSMPPDSPGKLSAQDRADVIAHILKVGAFPSGPGDLTRDAQELRSIIFRAARP